jgi:hypothetical protein
MLRSVESERFHQRANSDEASQVFSFSPESVPDPTAA